MLRYNQQESCPQKVLIPSLLGTQEQNRITRLKCYCKFDSKQRTSERERERNSFGVLLPKTEKQRNAAERQQTEDWVDAKSSRVSWVQHHHCPTFRSQTSLSNSWHLPGLHVCQKSPQTTKCFCLQEKMTVNPYMSINIPSKNIKSVTICM